MKADDSPKKSKPASRTVSTVEKGAYGLGPDSVSWEKQRMIHARPKAQSTGNPKTGVGLWIDHRKAVIVFVTDTGTAATLVLSHIDKQLGRSEGRRSTTRFEPQLVPADDSHERRFTGQLALYYDAVIACIRDARVILAFGPGEAKGELRRRLALNKRDPRVFAFEVADKMTDSQIATRIRRWLDERQPVARPDVRRSGRPNR